MSFFHVFFSGLCSLCRSGFLSFFHVFFSGLCSLRRCCFLDFLHLFFVSCLSRGSSGCSSCRSSSWCSRSGISSKSSAGQSHGGSNNQCKYFFHCQILRIAVSIF